MVMGEDAGCGVKRERGFDDFAGVDGCATDRATEKFGELQHAVPVVEPQNGKYFMLPV